MGAIIHLSGKKNKLNTFYKGKRVIHTPILFTLVVGTELNEDHMKS